MQKAIEIESFFSTLLLFNNADNRKVLLRTELRKITTRNEEALASSLRIPILLEFLNFFVSFQTL